LITTFQKTFLIYGIGFLSLCYLISLVVVFTSIGSLVGIQLPIHYFFLKTILVSGFCLLMAYLVVRKLDKASEESGTKPIYDLAAKVFVFGSAVVLWVVTPALAILIGAGY
jgi:hypothetical protein